MRCATLLVSFVAGAFPASCGTDSGGWTVRQAESIASVRGTPINQPRCRGVGKSVDGRHQRFSCRAGARRPGDEYDTVAVLYELVPRGPYPEHEFEDVRFFGGPGIP